ncbi:MAG: hypothetical protein AAGI53_09315 [Planctomycetota bacterium]
MHDTTPPALVLSDGSLEGLVAAAMAVERAGLPTDRHAYLWVVPGRFEGADMVRETAAAAAERQRTLLKLGAVSARVPASAASTGEFDSALLLRAGAIAGELGLRRVIWPARAGVDRATGGVEVHDAARIVDRALLVTRLTELDADGPGVTIETPLVDLEDDQVADLAADLGAPMDAVWWAVNLDSKPGELARRERDRWTQAAVIGGALHSAHDRNRDADVLA